MLPTAYCLLLRSEAEAEFAPDLLVGPRLVRDGERAADAEVTPVADEQADARAGGEDVRAGVLGERSALGTKLGLRGGPAGWLFMACVTVLPVGLAFTPPFVHVVVLPFLTVIGAR